VSSTPVSPSPIRVFLFQRNLVDALPLCLAVEMSPLWCDVQMLDDDAEAVRSACAAIRCGAAGPGLVLLDLDLEGAASLETMSLLRRSPELGLAPLLVVGDREDAEAERRAYSNGADGYIRRPTRAKELARTGREIAHFWSKRHAKRA
jgi:DNA-binding NarL/FixJ family response regulator